MSLNSVWIMDIQVVIYTAFPLRHDNGADFCIENKFAIHIDITDRYHRSSALDDHDVLAQVHIYKFRIDSRFEFILRILTEVS